MRKTLRTLSLFAFASILASATWAHSSYDPSSDEGQKLLQQYALELLATGDQTLVGLGELAQTMVDAQQKDDIETLLATQAVFRYRISQLPKAALQTLSELQAKVAAEARDPLQKHGCSGGGTVGGGSCNPSACAMSCFPQEGICDANFCECI